MNILQSNHLGAPDEKNPKEMFKAGDNCKSEAFQQHMQQEGFGLSSPELKAANQLYDGRIIRSTGGKDRHSKVCTARGPRGRRVRLSPKTAISFYDVQERLGFDRPSKAIDWLIKEAKSAIDALDRPPPPASDAAEIDHAGVNSSIQHMLKTEIGNTEHLNNVDPVSGFGFFSPEAAPLETPPEIFDTNLEIARLQRIFSWNYNFPLSPPPPLNFLPPADLGHSYMFTDREPLQSRISNHSPRFPVVNFSNEELLNFTGAATFKEDEMDILPVSSKLSSSTASFLH